MIPSGLRSPYLAMTIRIVLSFSIWLGIQTLLKAVVCWDERHISSFQNSKFRRLASRKKLTLWTVLHRSGPTQMVDKNAQKSFDAFYGSCENVEKTDDCHSVWEQRLWVDRGRMATAAQLGGKSNCLLLALDCISLNICSVFLLIYSCIYPSLVTVRIHPFSQASSPTVFRRVAHSRLLSHHQRSYVESILPYLSFGWKSYHLAATRVVNA